MSQRPGPGAPAPRPYDWRARLPTAALILLGVVLYGRGLTLGFVGDDYTLLDAALRHSLGELLSGRHGILGYYRPVSRELYFWGWGRIAGLGAGGFHLVNALTFAAVVVMIERLGRAWAGPRAGWLAAAAFLLFPPASALLAWVSCAQDLVMLFWAVGALLLYRRGHHAGAGLAVALAALSKETALVVPAALALMDWLIHPHATPRARAGRLAPALAGLGLAAAVSVAARASWPAESAVRIWSPAQFAGAWRLPLDFARTLLPPETGAGLAQAFESQSVWLVLAAALAALAVPGMVPDRNAPAPASGGGARREGGSASRGQPASSGARPGSATQAAAGARPGSASHAAAVARPGSASHAIAAVHPVVIFGLVLALLAMLPIGFVIERWRGYFFSLSAVGAALAAGPLLARLPTPLTRGALALAALVNFGAGGIYRPVEAAEGPARHPHVNYAFFRETGALSKGLLAALEPWCDSVRALPKTFLAGVPPSQVFETAIGPGLRVTCRDTVARVRFLAEFTPADAGADFGVLRLDAGAMRFAHERADARVRARVGEGFLIHARYDVAAACFEAAAGRAPDRELSYPLAVARAAAGRGEHARIAWDDALARGAVLDPATMAERLSGRVGAGGSGRPGTGGAGTAGADSMVRLAAAVLRRPWEAGPHRALGRALLGLGRGREATFELAAAAGIGRENADLAWLAQGYERMGLIDEALDAYRRALETGLAGDLYATTRDRFLTLMRQDAGTLDRPGTHP